MDPYEQARLRMVSDQLIARGVSDVRVLQAMRWIPRHLFVAQKLWGKAYDDCALSIGEGQTISQPYMVGIMTEHLQLDGHERVLEIGTGSGYQTAVLASIVRHVWTIERIQILASTAQRILSGLGSSNVTVRVGDGTLGWPEQAPFDAIIVAAGAPLVPQSLIHQLKESGRMLIPVGDRKRQVLHKIVKDPDGVRVVALTGCVFVPLVGNDAWRDERLQDSGSG